MYIYIYICTIDQSVLQLMMTDINILLMVEEGIRGGICHTIHRYRKADNKYLENYDKSKKSLYLNY